MKSLFYRLFAATLIALPASAYPEVTGNELYEQMNSNNKLAAMWYVRGVSDVLNGDFFCTPSGSTFGQIYDAIESHLKHTPTLRHFSAAVIIGSTLKKLYPCDSNKKL